MNRTRFHISLLLSIITLRIFSGGGIVLAEIIDPDDDGSQYAWAENAGWLNLEPGGDGGPGVIVGDSVLTGYMWGENVGWISLSCEDSGTCGTLPYGVTNDGAGSLAGYAWGENAGWISFSCENTESCGTVPYGVTINPATGEFGGHAWGENIGWINFAPAAGGGAKTSWSGVCTDGDADGFAVEGGDCGPIDCDDANPGVNPGAAEAGSCSDVTDNDCDGLTDCSDPDCFGQPGCLTETLCRDGLDNDGDGCTDSDDVDCGGYELVCSDFLDDDCDSRTDCADPDCFGQPGCLTESLCADGQDNDADGCTDGADADCGGIEFVCGDLLDDDCDGPIDCADPDCFGQPGCLTETLCADGQDNDADGCTDGADADCGGIEFVCNDLLDNDCDGLADAADPDCDVPGGIDPDNDGSRYAWGENIGWINLKPPFNPAATVTDSAVTGFAWSENVGWINLDPASGGVVNDGAGNLSGYAWGENTGWISFACENTGSCGVVDYGVQIDPGTGDFSGHALGENIWWINFDPAAGGGAKTSWRGECTDGDGDGYAAQGGLCGPADCDDSDPQVHPGAAEAGNCSDVTDNDCDGLVDCADPDCFGPPDCLSEAFCGDGQDNDFDGCIDEADADCGGIEVVCADIADEDCDGLADCADSDCFGPPDCLTESFCGDGLDNDADGCADTADADCGGIEVVCNDLLDNDCDGLADATDPDCDVPGGIDPDNDGSRYAWGENIGWINLKPLFNPVVTVTDSTVTGFAWDENVGWINMDPSGGGVVNDGAGNLSGFAWGENTGWISFSCLNTGSCGAVTYGVTIDPATGEFSGYAWGENIGWVNFDPAAGGGAKTSWRGGTINPIIQALSGSASCPACSPALPTDLPNYDVGLDIYQDHITIENISGVDIPLPIHAELTVLTATATALCQPAYPAGTCVGSGVPGDTYWEYSSSNPDCPYTAGVSDPIFPTHEKISLLWQFDANSQPFSFWADLYCVGTKRDMWLDRFDFSSVSPAQGPKALGARQLFAVDDGTAEIHTGSETGLVILANRYTAASSVRLDEVSFYMSGAAEGDRAEVIVYEDPSGEASVPDPSMEVWRATVVLGGGGFQLVSAAGCPALNPGGLPGAAVFVALANTSEQSCSLGIDLSGAGFSYVSTDGGSTFAPLSSVPIIDGHAMIRAKVVQAPTCFIGSVK